MQVKSFLTNFWLIGNVFKIVAVQAFSLFFLSYAAGLLAVGLGVRGCSPRPEFNNWFLWIMLTTGLIFTAVAVYYILFPSVWMQTINKHLIYSATDANLPFFSTHPLYVFLDILFFIPAIAMFQAGRAETMCRFNFQWAMGWTVLGLAVFFLVLRIIAWSVLKRQIEAMTLKNLWMPLVWFYVFALPVFGFFTYTYMDSKFFPRLRVPVVNEMTFAGGLSKHPEFEEQIVRVQGKLVREIAKCGLFGKDPEEFDYPRGTVLLDMGKGNGQIMVQAKSVSEVKRLEIEAENKMGEIFEAFGTLSKLPNLEKKLVCGIGKADSEQKGGLALLEIEMPKKD